MPKAFAGYLVETDATEQSVSRQKGPKALRPARIDVSTGGCVLCRAWAFVFPHTNRSRREETSSMKSVASSCG